MRWRLPILSCFGLGLLASSTPPDLDVGIPPGSPTSWGRRFPAITPRGGPLFPLTPSGKQPGGGELGKGKGGGQTVARSKTAKMDVRMSSSFGVLRILTWDIANHLRWLNRETKEPKGPVTGPSARRLPLPVVSDSLYWVNMAALLRLLLHPQLVSEKELIAHLVEVGEPVLAVLDNAVSQTALEETCSKLRKMITARRRGVVPLKGVTARETMLKRFLAEELTSVYPYDPEGGFGRRFLLLAEEVEPYLVEYMDHADPFLRRNAVAALGRCRSDSAMQALARVAAKSDDQVVLMRALAALGAYVSPRQRKGLLERLQSTKDPVQRVALVVAVGRMRMQEALPTLLRFAARKKDPDLLQAVLAALLRIGAPGEGGVMKLARRIARSAHAKPQRYQVPSRGGPMPDVPDGSAARGQVMEQLALLLRVRLDPKDKDAKARVLKMLPRAKRAIGGRRPVRRARFANDSLRGIHPPVQLLFLETLRGMGKEGLARLKSVAGDVTVEPPLRGHALSQLPYFERGSMAEKILDSRSESVEVKIYAFEVMDRDSHPRLKEIGLDLVKGCGRAAGGTDLPEQRYLWLQALRALDRRHLLQTDDLLALLKHPKAYKPVDKKENDRIGDLVESLVDDAVAGMPRRLRRQRIDAILDLVISKGINRRITAANREAARKHVEGQLDGLKGHRGDVRYKTRVKAAVLSYLGGFRARFTIRDQAQFKPVVLLEEEILLALGRTKTKEAAKALADFLAEHPRSHLRAHACLALGMSTRPAFAKTLVPMLIDEDGFTRFCAYESLRHLTGKDFWTDWLYGGEEERGLVAEQYLRWLNKIR